MEKIRLAFWFIFASESIAGIIINLIILAATFIKWKTMKSLHIGDKILSFLATSRSLFLLIFFLSYLFSVFGLWNTRNHHGLPTILVITMFLHCTNLWFASVLCVFYCVKITSYNWKFFIFLKTKISPLVPWFLLASLLISAFCGLPFGWCIYRIQAVTNVSMNNMTLPGAVVYENSQNLVLLILIDSCPPFIIFLVADCLLIHSLWMHTRRMRSSGSGFRSPNLETHFSVVKSMSLFLVLQMIYFCMTVYSCAIEHRSTIAYWIASIVLSSPPSLHSLYIISSDRELKKRFISMISVFTCCARG